MSQIVFEECHKISCNDVPAAVKMLSHITIILITISSTIPPISKVWVSYSTHHLVLFLILMLVNKIFIKGINYFNGPIVFFTYNVQSCLLLSAKDKPIFSNSKRAYVIFVFTCQGYWEVKKKS